MIGAKFPATFLLESALPIDSDRRCDYLRGALHRHWYWDCSLAVGNTYDTTTVTVMICRWNAARRRRKLHSAQERTFRAFPFRALVVYKGHFI